MNSGVQMFQRTSDNRIKTLIRIQYGAIIVVLVLLGMAMLYIQRQVTGPITDLVDSMNEGATQVAMATDSVARTSQDMAQQATDNASNIEESSASLGTLETIARTNVKSIEQVNHLAENVRKTSQDGGQLMVRMTQAIDSIKNSSDDTRYCGQCRGIGRRERATISSGNPDQ